MPIHEIAQVNFHLSAVSFQICVANRYKLNKKYRKLKTKADQNSDDIRIKNQASQAEVSTFTGTTPDMIQCLR